MYHLHLQADAGLRILDIGLLHPLCSIRANPGGSTLLWLVPGLATSALPAYCPILYFMLLLYPIWLAGYL